MHFVVNHDPDRKLHGWRGRLCDAGHHDRNSLSKCELQLPAIRPRQNGCVGPGIRNDAVQQRSRYGWIGTKLHGNHRSFGRKTRVIAEGDAAYSGRLVLVADAGEKGMAAGRLPLVKDVPWDFDLRQLPRRPRTRPTGHGTGQAIDRELPSIPPRFSANHGLLGSRSPAVIHRPSFS